MYRYMCVTFEKRIALIRLLIDCAPIPTEHTLDRPTFSATCSSLGRSRLRLVPGFFFNATERAGSEVALQFYESNQEQ